jgi:hypothetical protein
MKKQKTPKAPTLKTLKLDDLLYDCYVIVKTQQGLAQLKNLMKYKTSFRNYENGMYNLPAYFRIIDKDVTGHQGVLEDSFPYTPDDLNKLVKRYSDNKKAPYVIWEDYFDAEKYPEYFL